MAHAESDSGVPGPILTILLLPGPLAYGFVTVTLGYVLAHHGFSVAAVAGLGALVLLPVVFSCLLAPIVDVTLTPRRWVLIGGGGAALVFVALGFLHIEPSSANLLRSLCVTAALLCALQGAAVVAAMVAMTPPSRRGALAGWAQIANLSGAALGGGLALWLVTHAGGVHTACLALAGTTLLACTPILALRIPPRTIEHRLGARVRATAADVAQVMRSRAGVLAFMVQVLPAALGAATGLLPPVAGQWHADADLVALVNGALRGLVTAPGCLLGGYLCSRWRHRTVYMWAALLFALGEAAMAVGPRTPIAFAAFTLAEAFILGVAFAGLAAITFDILDARTAATVSTFLTGASNIPLVVVGVVVGRVGTASGASGMLLTEATLGIVSVAAYASVASLWRPAPALAVSG
jgi:MFS transporter, PAT family, beta-lactamase induction signal transducer AmpG